MKSLPKSTERAKGGTNSGTSASGVNDYKVPVVDFLMPSLLFQSRHKARNKSIHLAGDFEL